MSVEWSPILHHNDAVWHIASMNSLGPVTPAGQQVVGLDAGLWQASLSSFVIWSTDHVLEWRGIVAALQGGLETLIIGPCDCRQAPFPGAGAGLTIGSGLPHSDGALFSAGIGYAQSSVQIVLAVNAARRATHLRCTIILAGPLRRGMYFSVADRLHIITSMPTLVAPNQYEFDFLPPLRAAATAGAAVEFARPRATMRLASPSAGRMNLRHGRFGDGSLELVESFHGLG